MRSRRNHLFYIFLSAIVLLAFLVRLQVCRELYSSDVLCHDPPENKDMFMYRSISEKIIEGTFEGDLAFQPFYPVFFLPAVYLIFGRSLWCVLVAQSLLGAATAWIVGICCAMSRSRRSGLVAALLMALSFMSILYTSYLLVETLKAFLTALLAFLLIMAMRRRSLCFWAATGAAVSCLVLTRSNTFLLLPPVLFLALFSGIKTCWNRPPRQVRGKQIFRSLLPFLAVSTVSLLMLVPVSIYNSLKTGEIHSTSTASVSMLGLCNNPESPPGTLSVSDTYLHWMENRSEISITKRVATWIIAEPLVFMELAFRKLLLFWDSEELSNNLPDFARYSEISPTLRLKFIPTTLLLALFIASTIALKKRFLLKTEALTMLLLLLFYWLSFSVAFNLARYRIAILPLLAAFSGFLIDDVFVGRINGRKALRLGISMAAGFFLVFMAYPLYRNSLEKRVFSLIQPEGVVSRMGDIVLYTDNGPLALGGHHPIPLVSGSEIVKTFSAPQSSAGRPARLQIILQCKTDKPLYFRLNGELLTIHPQRNTYEHDDGTRSFSLSDIVASFRATVPEDGVFRIFAEDIPPESVFFYIDLQRDHGRTVINGLQSPGELVGRLLINQGCR
ncbi:MAG: glycosyltransferase family 39 protein [Victivallales bacterium]|nr:glycosyltransferase family 39 protein [Victivallales bacterium]